MKVNRRSLLVKVGMDLFARYGYRDVSVEDITQTAGLSVGTFYKYFRGKESFYDQILALIEREGVRKLERAVTRLHSPINRLRTVFRFVVLGLRRYPILRGVLSGDQRFLYPGIQVSEGSVGSLRRRVEELIAEIVRDGSRRAIFRAGLYADATALVTAMLDTLIMRLDDPRIDRLLGDSLTLLDRGMRRALRLRRRDERLDRRIMSDDDVLDILDR